MLKIPVEHVLRLIEDAHDVTVETKIFNRQRVAIIRTTDRGKFRHCRRAWKWSSAMNDNLRGISVPGALWFGTGMHYALEDAHGINAYGKIENAFSAYVTATMQTQREDYQLPSDWEDHLKLGYTMMKYYRQVWLKTRSPLETFVYNGVPQTEVNFIVEVPFDLARFGYDKWWDKVVYAGTIDRVVIDEYGTLWLVDYKSAKAMKSTHLNNDPQVCTYTWLASQYYPGYQIGGFIYWQFLKTAAKLPRTLKTTGHVTVAKNLKTSAELYRLGLKRRYGLRTDGTPNAPEAQMNYWTNLMTQETADVDKFIRRDYLPRSKQAVEAEGAIIMMELEDILNRNLPLYPNRNWMCNMCEFFEPCISLDDGSDWKEQIDKYAEREDGNARNAWKKYLPAPESFEPKDPGLPMEILLTQVDSDEGRDTAEDAEEAKETELEQLRTEQQQEIY